MKKIILLEEYRKNFGKSLQHLGLYDVAFDYRETIYLIDNLHKLYIPIFGGDVYTNTEAGVDYPECPFDWHCDRNSGETTIDYINRSYMLSLEKVKYFHKISNLYCFVIVYPTESDK